MRITLDLQACQAQSADRGMGRYSMMLAQTLARQAITGGRDHEISIVLNNNLPVRARSVMRAFHDLVPPERIHVFNVPQGAAEALPNSAWCARAGERIREQYLSRLKPDFVHISSLFEGWADEATHSVGMSDQRADFATAITLYDLIPLIRPDVYLRDPKLRDWYYRKLAGLKNAELLLGISAFSTTEVASALQLPAHRVVNISSAIDSIFKPRILSSVDRQGLRERYGITRDFVMYTGGIDPRKNIEGLIEAYSRLPLPLRKKYQLAVVCKIRPEDRVNLRALAKRVQLEAGDLVLTDFVPDDDLVSLYNDATLFVFPSLYEGFGMPILEAMACGTAAIGSNNSSIPEVIGREDALFDASSIDAITAKLAETLENEHMRRDLAAHGLQRAKLFSWEKTGSRTLDALEQAHERRQQASDVRHSCASQGTSAMRTLRRPRLALVTPILPVKSGIADYVAELLPELTRHYQIDVVSIHEVDDPWALGNCQIRSLDWFESHAQDFDHVLYHIGNSSFHAHMFDMLERIPGVVVLHDFFLSGAISYLNNSSQRGAFSRALYRSHGYPALADPDTIDRQSAIWKYPLNKQVLDDATGVIVHSRYSQTLADQWYGKNFARDWAVIPHLRALADATRDHARQALAIAPETFLTCSFGLLAPTKLNHELLLAWLASPLGENGAGRLVFVGLNDEGAYGKDLERMIADCGCAERISITGFASTSIYRQYLAGADMAIQLRTRSRGETSGTILDCLAHGLPTIINANGSAGELPEQALVKMPNEFTVDMLTEHIGELYRDSAARAALALRARDYIQTAHHPDEVGQAYRQALERFARDTPQARAQRVTADIARIAIEGSPDAGDMAAAARAIALNLQQPASPAQLLIDISCLRTAGEEVNATHAQALKQLLITQVPGYRLELIYSVDGRYHYACAHACRLLDLPGNLFADVDAEIDTHPGDLLIRLEDAAYNQPLPFFSLLSTRNRRVHVHIHVLQASHGKTDAAGDALQIERTQWTESVAQVADSISAGEAAADVLGSALARPLADGLICPSLIRIDGPLEKQIMTIVNAQAQPCVTG